MSDIKTSNFKSAEKKIEEAKEEIFNILREKFDNECKLKGNVKNLKEDVKKFKKIVSDTGAEIYDEFNRLLNEKFEKYNIKENDKNSIRSLEPELNKKEWIAKAIEDLKKQGIGTEFDL